MSNNLALALLLGASIAATPAAASVLPSTFFPNYSFPDGAHGFALASHGGPINPGVLVGFNPQPDPPGDNTIVLGNPFNPVLPNPTTDGRPFDFQFSLLGIGTGSLPFPNAPSADHHTGFRFLTGGHVIDVAFVFGPDNPITWGAFNPQPDPPGDVLGIAMSFPVGDPMASFSIRIDDRPLSFTLTQSVPELGTWAMMIIGFAGIGMRLRSRPLTA